MGSSNPAIPVLNYAAPTTAASGQRTPLQIALFVFALPGLVVPFVSFTYSTSPLDAVTDIPQFGSDMWVFFSLGLTYFFGLPILLWKARRLIFTGPPAQPQRRTLLAVSIVITMPALFVVAWMCRDVPPLIKEGDFTGEMALMLSVALSSLFASIGACMWRWRRRRDALAATEALLVAGYLTNAAMTLLAFHDQPELGYWLAIPVAASFAAELFLPRPGKL